MALTSELEEYNRNWPELFEMEKSCLLPICNSDLIAIHHVGSTAIPGMLGKPEIDILVILRKEADFPVYFPKIEALGYNFRGEEPGEPRHWYFSKNQNGKRTHKLHLCDPDHNCVDDQLIFRDYLRRNSDRALAYRNLKELLAKTNSKGMVEYLAKKSPFIQETLSLARALRG